MENSAKTGKVYHGQSACQNAGCKNKAYFSTKVKGEYLCGVHSRKLGKDRKPLPKPTKLMKEQAVRERMNELQVGIEESASVNRKVGTEGSVILTKMYMLRNPDTVAGYIKVFPNYKHQNRKDGYGCMKLSPKFLGPVIHGQPGLPHALNIENFHQGSKCFREEVDVNNDQSYSPSKSYYKNRLDFYNDPVPHRHKFKGQGKNKNIPVFFIWVDKSTGSEVRLDYIQCRQFYCNFYERLAKQQQDYQHLVDKIKEGYNLQICGYDARSMKGKTVEDAYLDDSLPFGHELVLYTMLTEKDETKYPWRVHKTFDF